MTNMGEWLMVLAVALIVIGPERLPQVARTLGRLAGQARRFAHNMKIMIESQSDQSDNK